MGHAAAADERMGNERQRLRAEDVLDPRCAKRPPEPGAQALEGSLAVDERAQLRGELEPAMVEHVEQARPGALLEPLLETLLVAEVHQVLDDHRSGRGAARQGDP